jgi:hypothetical protein
MDNNNWIIVGKKTNQVTEEKYERQSRSLKIDSSTTVEQIFLWAKTNHLDLESGLTMFPLDTI